jgi:hypothetical protein
MVTGFYVGSKLNSYIYISRNRGTSFQRTPGRKPGPLGSNGPAEKGTDCHIPVDPAKMMHWFSQEWKDALWDRFFTAAS